MVIEEIENINGNKYEIKKGEKKNEIVISEKEVKETRNKRFTIGMDNYNIVEYIEKNGKKEMIKINYLNWIDFGKIKFPEELKIEIHKDDEKRISILKYERIELDGKINTKFRIPDGYKVIKL